MHYKEYVANGNGDKMDAENEDNEKISQCVFCKKDLPISTLICPNCGKSQIHGMDEKSVETILKIAIEKNPKMKDDDGIEPGKNEIGTAFKSNILNEKQRNVLITIITKTDTLRYGQRKVLSSLIIGLIHEIDTKHRSEGARLLKRYLKTLGMQEDIVNNLSIAFGLSENQEKRSLEH